MTDQQYAHATEVRARIQEAVEEVHLIKQVFELSRTPGAQIRLDVRVPDADPGCAGRTAALYPATDSIAVWISQEHERRNARLTSLLAEYAAI